MDELYIIVVSVVFGAVFLYVGVPFLYGKYLQILLYNKTTRSKSLILTFDDGPGSRLTPLVLNMLAQNNVKATFFLLGRNIQGREDIVKQIAVQGHEICSHSYEHLHHWKVSPFRAVKDIKKGWESIDNALGTTKDKYSFRPPYGKLNIISLIYLLVHKVPICYWTIVTGDTWMEDKRDINHSVSVLKTKNGGATLAHDFDRSSNNTDEFVIESLVKIIATVGENNIKIITFAELND